MYPRPRLQKTMPAMKVGLEILLVPREAGFGLLVFIRVSFS